MTYKKTYFLSFLFFALSLIKADISFGQTVYTFTGNGNWSDTIQWLNNSVPPQTLLSGDTIIIGSNATCYLNIPQTISKGASLIILTGGNLIVMGNLTDLNVIPDKSQYLIVSVDSTEIDTLFYENIIPDTTIQYGWKDCFASYIDTPKSKSTALYFLLNNGYPFPGDIQYTFIGDTLKKAYLQHTDIYIQAMPDTGGVVLRGYLGSAPFTIYITEYDRVGGFVSGYFTVLSHSYDRYVPSIPIDNWVTADHLLMCRFRVYRKSNNSDH